MTEENAVDTQEQELGQEIEAEGTGEEQTSGNEEQEKINIEKAKEKTPVWLQKKIDKATWEGKEKDRRIKNLEVALNKIESEKPQEIKPPLDKPHVEDFNTNEEFSEALFDYKFAQNDAAKEEKDIAEYERSEQNKKYDDFEQKRSSVMGKGVEKYDNFNEIVGSMPTEIMSENVALALVETPNAEDVAYYLGNNIGEAQKISELSSIQIAIKVGEISTKLKNKPKIEKSSSAEPIKTISGSQINTDKDPMEMTDKEYTAYRRKRVKNRRY